MSIKLNADRASSPGYIPVLSDWRAGVGQSQEDLDVVLLFRVAPDSCNKALDSAVLCLVHGCQVHASRVGQTKSLFYCRSSQYYWCGYEVRSSTALQRQGRNYQMEMLFEDIKALNILIHIRFSSLLSSNK